ncbi:hypothetical protein Avbf_07807 [Armadillidium vulgare]|nr:hypothetical protein Avbf_07807 [Armadillidium vulgare]
MDHGKTNIMLVLILLAISLGEFYTHSQNIYLNLREKLPEEVTPGPIIRRVINGEFVTDDNIDPPKLKPSLNKLCNTNTATPEEEMDAFCREACPTGDGGAVCNCANYPFF